jgi:hypothetical protein
LNGRTRQQKSIAAFEGEERIPAETLRVLDRLRFIEDHVLPPDLGEVRCIKDSLMKTSQFRYISTKNTKRQNRLTMS